MDNFKRITDTVQLYFTQHFDNDNELLKSMIYQYYSTIVIILSSIISTFLTDLITNGLISSRIKSIPIYIKPI